MTDFLILISAVSFTLGSMIVIFCLLMEYQTLPKTPKRCLPPANRVPKYTTRFGG